nr:hypothetical protein GCM10017745_78280 [Saccharothrix mutabilis subsp. capreolus]
MGMPPGSGAWVAPDRTGSTGAALDLGRDGVAAIAATSLHNARARRHAMADTRDTDVTAWGIFAWLGHTSE